LTYFEQNQFTMKHILVYLSISLFFTTSFAQSDIDQLIKGSSADANYLVKGYVTPALNTIGFGLNQGWYNTAKAHKLIGFDLTITVSGISIPTSDLTYRVENSQLSNLAVTPYPATTGIDAPTIFGSETAPVYQPLVNKTPSGSTINGAPGLDLKKSGFGFIPIPMVQLGIGLPKGTDLKLRFFPSTKLGSGGSSGSVSMFGIGVMHDIKQYIPGIKKLPFDLSAFVGYTTLKFDVGLDSSKPDQKANFTTSATTVQGLISKKFSVITFYGGLGYNFVSSDLNVKGTYTLDSTLGTTIKDPISISDSQSGPRISAGLRLKLAIFTFHGDYTLQKYNSFTVGFGFAVR
jgi:hypothetical protein